MEQGLTTFEELVIAPRVFQVPIYQRNYSWKEPQLEDLWNDLFYLGESKRHYFGTVLLKTTDKIKAAGELEKEFEVYEIIDGQQRLTTTLILLREIIVQLEKVYGESVPEDIQGELRDLKNSYLNYKGVYKLELLGEDKEFFKKVIEGEEYPDEILTPSQRRLRKGSVFYRNKLNEIKAENPANFKNFLIELKDKIENLEIIKYGVENQSDAVLIFETVNDRGIDLSRLDKTKSFLMHMVYLSEPEDAEQYLKQLNERFSNVFRYFEKIKDTDRGKNLDEEKIQRYHFVTFEAGGNRDTSYNYLDFLKRKIREKYRRGDRQGCLKYALKYARDLEKAFYAATEVITYNAPDELGLLLEKLYTQRSVAIFYPLLIAIWMKYRDQRDKIKEILRLIEILAFRVHGIGRRRSNTGETRVYRMAYKIHREGQKFNETKQELKYITRHYEGDENFEKNLKAENFYQRIRKRGQKYLLFEYEKYLREKAKEPLEINLQQILSNDFQIEHIWSRNAKIVSEELKEIHEQYKDRLGNLTLASRSWNAHWGNKSFDVKRDEYQGSSLRVQKKLSSFTNWGKEQIEEREERVRKFAMERWRI